VISTEEFRRKLAGLVDPDRGGGDAEAADVKEAAHRLGCVLAHLFGEDLDRMTLWERIAGGFATACAKVDDGDLDRFVSLCLEHVKADAAKASACGALGELLQTFGVRPIEWRHRFVGYVRSHYYPVVVHSRARWELVKKGQSEL